MSPYSPELNRSIGRKPQGFVQDIPSRHDQNAFGITEGIGRHEIHGLLDVVKIAMTIIVHNEQISRVDMSQIGGADLDIRIELFKGQPIRGEPCS